MCNREAHTYVTWTLLSFVSQPHGLTQILTGTVMKYHVSVDCQESYIFPREVRSTEGKYCPDGKYNYLGTTDT